MTQHIPTAEKINAMTDIEVKVLENRLRRAAARQGLRLTKSRRRDPRASDWHTYSLIWAESNVVECLNIDLDQVAKALA